MKKYTTLASAEVIDQLRSGGIGVLLTDTLYGVVASAHYEQAIERIYKVKGREPNKPCIVLIDSLAQIWNSHLPLRYKATIERYWPGRVSIVLPAGEHTPPYIHRGGHTVAYRMPDNSELRELLRATGPLVAPSANPEGSAPAMNIAQAEAYFGNSVDFYVDSGTCKLSQPSRLIELSDSGIKVLR